MGREKHAALVRDPGTRGAGRVPPNVPLWHMNCLELKALEKRLRQERHPDLVPWKRETLPHVKGASPAPGKQKVSSSLETELRAGGLYKQTLSRPH